MGEPISQDYNKYRKLRDIVLNLLYRFVNPLPGFIRNIEIPDRFTGDFVKVNVGVRYTIITVNNRDYYFNRITGYFAGTGYALCRNTIEEQLYCILGHTHESTRPLSVWGRLRKLLPSIG
jgi:hypothetical protein